MTAEPTISDEAVDAFWRDGFVCLRDVVPAEWRARLAGPPEAAPTSGEAADPAGSAGPHQAGLLPARAAPPRLEQMGRAGRAWEINPGFSS